MPKAQATAASAATSAPSSSQTAKSDPATVAAATEQAGTQPANASSQTTAAEPSSGTDTQNPAQSDTPVQVEVVAYYLWLERGCPIGSPEVDWMEAERICTRSQANTEK